MSKELQGLGQRNILTYLCLTDLNMGNLGSNAYLEGIYQIGVRRRAGGRTKACWDYMKPSWQDVLGDVCRDPGSYCLDKQCLGCSSESTA